jgi:hypothetical protein
LSFQQIRSPATVQRNPTIIALTAFAVLVTPLTACAQQQLGDQLPPGMGGLPPGAPARTSAPLPYPAVHDIPPPRVTAPLTDEQQLKLERELEAVRARQEKLQDPKARARAESAEAASAAAAKKARAAAKSMQKKPSAAPAQ